MSAYDLLYGAALGAYLLALGYVTVYCLLQLHLLWAYLRREGTPAPAGVHAGAPARRLPAVTVQLPLYNERYVAERVIDAVCAFDYPRDRLQVQVLDDSDDDTVGVVAARVALWRARGVDIAQVRRPERHGYKAGALADAMPLVKGEFVAIFDADFVPARDFLRRSVPHFADARTGVVQSRWEHLNEDHSVITRLQALQLNVHFTVEQSGRRAADLFAQFNGTAGVWRRACIDDAGGWRADTLTEDLDLSIRAQLRGWTVRYLEDNRAPAELPVEMNAFKSQQHRWMKGGAETARKLLPSLWRDARLTLAKKLHITSHLLASSIFLFVFLIGVLSVPTAFAVAHFALPGHLFGGFLVATLAVGAVYYVANVHASWRRVSTYRALLRFAVLFPLFLCLSMGLSLHNTVAVLQGFRGKKSPFVRTPKFALGLGNSVAANAYRARKLKWTTLGEGALALLFVAAVAWGLHTGNTFFTAFHAMLAVGYASIFVITLRHTYAPHTAAAPPSPPASSTPPRREGRAAAAPPAPSLAELT